MYRRRCSNSRHSRRLLWIRRRREHLEQRQLVPKLLLQVVI